MNPDKIIREKVRRFTDLPNIGRAGAKDFELLGFKEPSELVGAEPLKLFEALCAASGSRQDPCVLDVLISVTHFLDGGKAAPWWHFTDQRKRQYGHLESVSGKTSRATNQSHRHAHRHGVRYGNRPFLNFSGQFNARRQIDYPATSFSNWNRHTGTGSGTAIGHF